MGSSEFAMKYPTDWFQHSIYPSSTNPQPYYPCYHHQPSLQTHINTPITQHQTTGYKNFSDYSLYPPNSYNVYPPNHDSVLYPTTPPCTSTNPPPWLPTKSFQALSGTEQWEHLRKMDEICKATLIRLEQMEARFVKQQQSKHSFPLASGTQSNNEVQGDSTQETTEQEDGNNPMVIPSTESNLLNSGNDECLTKEVGDFVLATSKCGQVRENYDNVKIGLTVYFGVNDVCLGNMIDSYVLELEEPMKDEPFCDSQKLGHKARAMEFFSGWPILTERKLVMDWIFVKLIWRKKRKKKMTGLDVEFDRNLLSDWVIVSRILGVRQNRQDGDLEVITRKTLKIDQYIIDVTLLGICLYDGKVFARKGSGFSLLKINSRIAYNVHVDTFLQELLCQPLHQEVYDKKNKAAMAGEMDFRGERKWIAIVLLARIVQASGGEIAEVVLGNVEELAKSCLKRSTDSIQWMDCLDTIDFPLENAEHHWFQDTPVEPTGLQQFSPIIVVVHGHLHMHRVVVLCLGFAGFLEKQPSEGLLKQLRFSFINCPASIGIIEPGIWHGHAKVERAIGMIHSYKFQDDRKRVPWNFKIYERHQHSQVWFFRRFLVGLHIKQEHGLTYCLCFDPGGFKLVGSYQYGLGLVESSMAAKTSNSFFFVYVYCDIICEAKEELRFGGINWLILLIESRCWYYMLLHNNGLYVNKNIMIGLYLTSSNVSIKTLPVQGYDGCGLQVCGVISVDKVLYLAQQKNSGIVMNFEGWTSFTIHQRNYDAPGKLLSSTFKFQYAVFDRGRVERRLLTLWAIEECKRAVFGLLHQCCFFNLEDKVLQAGEY